MSESLFQKFAGLKPATLLKKRLDKDFFLSILGNCQDQPFLYNSSGDCLWQLRQITGKHRHKGEHSRELDLTILAQFSIPIPPEIAIGFPTFSRHVELEEKWAK